MHFPLRHAFALLTLTSYVYCDTLTLTGASSKFIGWYVASNSVQALYAGTSWGTVSSSYAGDCDSNGNCAVATACASGTLSYLNGGTMLCNAPFTCATMTMYQASPSVLPSAYNYLCRAGWLASTVYKELQATTTASSSMSSSTPSPGSSTLTAIPSTTNAPVTVTVTAQPSATANPPKSSTSSGSSKGWIAGAVIGPLLGVALIAAALLWWRRRRATKVPTYELGNDTPGYPAMKYAYEKDPSSRPTELPAQQAPQELDGQHADR